MNPFYNNLTKKYSVVARLSVLLVGMLLAPPALAQSDEDDDGYQTEFIYGVNFNTNGGIIGGIIFRYSQALDQKMSQHFALEIVNVKHPKEFRYQGSGNSFIYGKNNYLFAFRPQYGRELLLFRKAPDEGVRINAIASAGPSFGLVKPYFIEYAVSPTETRIEQFDPDRHSTNSILGSSGLFRFDGSNIALGGHLKAGVTFAFGSFRSSVTGFEVGFMVEGYSTKIKMNPYSDANNGGKAVFTSTYLNLFFGGRK